MIEACPADRRERAKAEAALGGVLGSTPVEKRKTPQVLEQQVDDCGPDFAPLLWVDQFDDDCFQERLGAPVEDCRFGFRGPGRGEQLRGGGASPNRLSLV